MRVRLCRKRSCVISFVRRPQRLYTITLLLEVCRFRLQDETFFGHPFWCLSRFPANRDSHFIATDGCYTVKTEVLTIKRECFLLERPE